MAEEARLRAVAGLAEAMASAQRPYAERAPGPTPVPDGPQSPPSPRRAVARAAAEAARAALDGSFAAVSVWDRARGRLRVLANVGELAPGEEEFPADESYAVRDFPEITGDPHGAWVQTRDPRPVHPPGAKPCPARAAALRRRGRGSCVVAPVVVYGRAWGELYVARGPAAPAFTPADADFAAVLATVVAAGIAQSEQLAEARRLAFTDQLTGLANRRAVDAGLAEGVARHREHGVVLSLVVCDVNGLKRVNDERGHDAGDRLLERFGAVLSLCAAALPGTLAARLGGDEFCLLAVGPPADDVVAAAREVCRRAEELMPGEGVACGVASTQDPIGPVRSAGRLFRLADAAQYRAKAARAREPVVAGREPDDPTLHLADAPSPPPPSDRRRFRGHAGEDG